MNGQTAKAGIWVVSEILAEIESVELVLLFKKRNRSTGFLSMKKPKKEKTLRGYKKSILLGMAGL